MPLLVIVTAFFFAVLLKHFYYLLKHFCYLLKHFCYKIHRRNETGLLQIKQKKTCFIFKNET